MKISELSKHTGLAPSAIRYYESKGLLQVVNRQANGYRDYPEQALLVLKIIAGAQQAGFTLDEIQKVMPPRLSGWNHAELLMALNKKVADIEAMQQQLHQSKSNLLALLDVIQNKPQDMACDDNAKRILDAMVESGVPAKLMKGAQQPS